MSTHTQSLDVLHKLGVTDAQVRNLSDIQFQLLLGQQLRQMVLMHLKEGHGPVANAFRREFFYVQEALKDSDPSYRSIDAYIQNRSQAVFGDHVMMAVVGEMLAVSLDVNFRKGGQLQNTASVYTAGDSRPQITVDNDNNTHFSFKGRASGAGNNCLFHSVARALREDAAPALPPVPVQPVAAVSAPVSEVVGSTLAVSPDESLSEFAKDAYAAGADNDAEMNTTISELEKATHELNRLKIAVGIASFKGSSDGKSLAECQQALIGALKEMAEPVRADELNRLVEHNGRGRGPVLAAFGYKDVVLSSARDAVVTSAARKRQQEQLVAVSPAVVSPAA
ncbi:MAG: hypothetical protein P1U34_07195 [Coxiellaceae bacterium]|nr:hypothetical protein [Coxiellaceae bacterium]